MRPKLNEAYFLTMAITFGGILLAVAVVVMALGFWNGPPVHPTTPSTLTVGENK